jgi:hypothetical protein
MQKPFATQPELFVTTRELDHPALHALDDTEAVLDWSKIEPILSSIYASKTGRPSYPLLTLFRGLLLGVWYRLSDVQLSQCLYRDRCFVSFATLNWAAMFLKHQHWVGFAINWLSTIYGSGYWERSTASLMPKTLS